MTPKSKILRNSEGKIILKKPRMLTPEEQKEKTKDWIGTSHAIINQKKEMHKFHDSSRRAWND